MARPRQSGVYLIVNRQTGGFYIGSSVFLARRKTSHWTGLRTGKHHCRPLQNAFAKYGEDAFEWRVVAEMPQDEIRDAELALLRVHFRSPACYNTSDATDRPPMNDEIARMIGDKVRGIKRSAETRERMAVARRARIISEETKAKISATLTGRRGPRRSPEHIEAMRRAFTGLVRSPESRARMREAQSYRSPETRAKMSTGARNQTWSAESRAKLSASQKATYAAGRRVVLPPIDPDLPRRTFTGRKQSAEHVAKRVAAYKETVRIRSLERSSAKKA